jgi:hypothetical protein
MREVFCRKCRRRASVPVREPQGRPYGWLYVTVNVPPWFNGAGGKPYRAIGLFCSADCLAGYSAVIKKDEEEHRLAYEHE